MKSIVIEVAVLVVLCAGLTATGAERSPHYQLAMANLKAEVTRDGIVGLTLGSDGPVRAIGVDVTIEGCHPLGAVRSRALQGGGVELIRKVGRDRPSARCALTERFLPTPNSIRWEIDILSGDAPWSAPILAKLRWPSPKETLLWAPWIGGPNWEDPLLPKHFAKGLWNYGGGPGSLCIPLASVLDPQTDRGLTLAVSPEITLLKLQLQSSADGELVFRFENLRLGQGRRVKIAMDLTAHEADWRGGLRWMVGRYPAYFNPPNPAAAAMAGCGAYSHYEGELDVAKLRKMAFRCNWIATFDWPYFGLYLPPMPNEDATWISSGHESSGLSNPKLRRPMSYRMMNERDRRLRQAGFFALNYFDCTDFGSEIKGPQAVKPDLSESETWKDANTYLFRKIADGILRDSKGQFIKSWSGCILMDPGAPNFQAHLLEQAQRHIDHLPDMAGICIDVLNRLAYLNPFADDGVGWYGGKRGRAISQSWKDFMSKLGPMMHRAGKVIYVNPANVSHRLDYMLHVDGFYDEFGDDANSLNGTSLLALRKPAMTWVHTADRILKAPDTTPDGYFQRHLHLGAYPTAPYPGNDHTIRPGTAADQYFLDYGPLLDAMRGKQWVLAPHCIEVAGGAAKANLFEVPGGWVAPVTFGPDKGTVKLTIRNVAGLEGARVEEIHPGAAKPRPLAADFKDDVLEVSVPLRRGCAMVAIHK